MNISMIGKRCERNGVNPRIVTAMESAAWVVRNSAFRRRCRATTTGGLQAELQTLLFALLVAGALTAGAESTNSPASTNGLANGNPPPRVEAAHQKLDEAAFRLISERNIFNANRSGGRVVLATSRPRRIESFKLVGTMAYEKGAFAFFEGSSSELTKVVKADGVIAGHKLVDILTDAVKLEADGKILEVPIGSAMRREDEGTWRLGEAVAGSGSASYVSSRETGNSDRSNRSGRNDRDNDSSRSRRGDTNSERGNTAEPSPAAAASPAATADQSEILKLLMERRAKESQ